jgi:hypothetical protein
MRPLDFFGFEVAERRFFPWIRDILRLVKDFCLGEGIFLLLKRFSLWQRDFSLFVEDLGLDEGIFLLLKGFSLGEGAFPFGVFPSSRSAGGRGEGRGGKPPPLLQGEGLRPLARTCKPLLGTGRGGEDLAPIPHPPPFPGPLSAILTPMVFQKRGGFPFLSGYSPFPSPNLVARMRRSHSFRAAS